MSKLTISDVTAMARAAGILIPAHRNHIEEMMRFAELVAEKEREDCAKICDKHASEIYNLLADDYYDSYYLEKLAMDIRARGKK